ncbi:MAG: tRNA glutamyl-Q(34) synthetase GluQRS [Pseudomonadota bacterium]
MSQHPVYTGRFAPSPTGPLHFGSLVAAVGSYLEARSHGGQWLLRMEDLDPPRCQPGADRKIIDTLHAYGFVWDGEVTWQSQRYEYYRDALERLAQRELIYPCQCTRKQIAARCSMGEYGPIYDGVCRGRSLAKHPDDALRLIVAGDMSLDDAVQGHYAQSLAREIGDFHLRRRDGLFAYHLGVVVDDAEQGITDIVRGYDLLDSTPRQIFLQRALGYPTPNYAHLPLVLKPDGQKFSKQNLSPAVKDDEAGYQLWRALEFLAQQPPESLRNERTAAVWDWAHQHWRLDRVARQPGIVWRESETGKA